MLDGIPPERINQVYHLVFARMAPEVCVLCDASKMARGWQERFLGDDTLNRKYIHLIRDPRALVRRWSLRPTGWLKGLRRRWQLTRAFPRYAPRMLWAPASEVLTYQWLHQNRRISRLIESNRLDAQVVTYRDLALDAAGELQRLMPWLGLAFEPGQCEYWKFEHHGTQKADYQWINEARTLHFDLRWQKDLSAEAQRHVIGNPDVLQYLASLGLTVEADGLTRVPVLGC
jgi:hypothetical protein